MYTPDKEEPSKEKRTIYYFKTSEDYKVGVAFLVFKIQEGLFLLFELLILLSFAKNIYLCSHFAQSYIVYISFQWKTNNPSTQYYSCCWYTVIVLLVVQSIMIVNILFSLNGNNAFATSQEIK